MGLEPTNPRSCSPGPCQLEYPLKKIGRLRGIIAALQKLDTVYCEKPALCFLKPHNVNALVEHIHPHHTIKILYSK